MNIETIISIIFGVGGIGSIVIKNYLDKQTKKEDRELDTINDLKEEINLLGERIDQLMQEKLDLSIKVARLEERLLVSAKNRIKVMNLTTKIIIALVVSFTANIVLLMKLFEEPKQQDNSLLYQEIDNSKKQVAQQQEKIQDLNTKIKQFRLVEDSLQVTLQENKQKLIKNNEAVYQIPNSDLNDSVKFILAGI